MTSSPSVSKCSVSVRRFQGDAAWGRMPREIPAAAIRVTGTRVCSSRRPLGTTTEMAAMTSPLAQRTGAATDDAPSVISSRDRK